MSVACPDHAVGDHVSTCPRSPEARDRAFATLAKLDQPETPRTAAATAARMRAREERYAAVLRERGWLAIPPEYVKIKDDSVGVREGGLTVGAGRE